MNDIQYSVPNCLIIAYSYFYSNNSSCAKYNVVNGLVCAKTYA